MEHFCNLFRGYDCGCGCLDVKGAEFFYILRNGRLYGNFISLGALEGVELGDVTHVSILDAESDDADVYICYSGSGFAGGLTLPRVRCGLNDFDQYTIEAIRNAYAQARGSAHAAWRVQRISHATA